MKKFIIFAVLFSVLMLIGCSQSKNSSVSPVLPEPPSFTESDTEALYEGTFIIDLDNNEIRNTTRNTNLVYDITGFLPDKCEGGCFRFRIVNVVGTVLEIELTIENPLAIQIYDVQVVYLELYGKTVLNPDSYTDFMGTPIQKFYPFTAFAKDAEDRAFPIGPGVWETETLFLDFPPGTIAAVDYAIAASLPGPTGAPYEITDMAQIGYLPPSGGNSTIECRVLDHQNDVTGVYLGATPFTGAPVMLTRDATDPDLYRVEISNAQNAPVGTYNQPIMALSPNPQNISTYNYVTINVSDVGPQDPIAIIDTIPDPPHVTTTNSIVTLDGTRSYDPDGGDIILYEWDLNWDGDPANFDPTIIGDLAMFDHDFGCAETTYTVALRVTDDNTPPGVSATASVDVVVTDDFEYGTFSPTIYLGRDQQIRGSDTYHTGQSIRVDSNGIAHIITKSSEGVHYRTFDGSDMSPDILVPSLTGNPRTISIAIDRDDEIHVMWQSNIQILHTKTVNQNFTGDVHLISTAQDGHRFSMMNVDVNVNKDIMFTWYDTDPENYGEMIYCLDTGSGFSAPEVGAPIWIRSGPSGGLMKSFRLISTPDGNFHYIYRGKVADYSYQQRIYQMTFDGTTWLEPREASANWITDLNAIAGLDGSIHITGRNHGTNYMEYIRYDPVADEWMPNMVIAYNSNPWVAGPMGTIMIAPGGYVHSIFVERTDELLHVKPFCQLWSETEIQNAPDFVIDPALDLQKYGHADAAWDHDGNLLIVHENQYQSDPMRFETVLNVLSYN